MMRYRRLVAWRLAQIYRAPCLSAAYICQSQPGCAVTCRAVVGAGGWGAHMMQNICGYLQNVLLLLLR